MRTERNLQPSNDPAALRKVAGWGMATGLAKDKFAGKEPARPEVQSSEEKPQDLSLGELNPLIHPIDFANRPVIESLKKVALDLISAHEGAQPVALGP